MISPQAQAELQLKIDAVIERAKSDPDLQAQVDEALAAAQTSHDRELASGICSSGLVGAQHRELLNRGLLSSV